MLIFFPSALNSFFFAFPEVRQIGMRAFRKPFCIALLKSAMAQRLIIIIVSFVIIIIVKKKSGKRKLPPFKSHSNHHLPKELRFS